MILDGQFLFDWFEVEYLIVLGYVGDFFNLFIIQLKDGYMYVIIFGGFVVLMLRGIVMFKLVDIKDFLFIDFKWFIDLIDQEVVVVLYKCLCQVFVLKVMKGVLVDIKEYFFGLDVKMDVQILVVIWNMVQIIWYVFCMCWMGKRDDCWVVVDKEVKVIGVDGLRVVDVSSFVLLLLGYFQSMVYVLVEKIVVEILWKNYGKMIV